MSQIGLILMIVTCLFALLKGGAAERYGASLIGTAWIASLGFQVLTPTGGREVTLLIVDFLLACGLLAIAIRYASLWIGTAMLLQAAILALHAEAMGGTTFSDRYHFYVALNVCSFGMLMPIAWASAVHWWRVSHRSDSDHPTARSAMPEAL